MLLRSRTSELSLCSIGFSASAVAALRSRPSFSSDSTSWSVVDGSGVRSYWIAPRSSFFLPTAVIGAADLLVGGAQRRLDRQAARQHGDDLHVGVELDLVERGAARRVVEGDHQAAVADQERHHAQPRGDAVVELPQCLGLDRERVDVDERIAHLARQRGLQVVARDDARAHQDLAERHAAVELLLDQRLLELRLRHHAEREQRLADAHQRHLVLCRDRLEQLVGGDDLLGHEDVAELLVAQLVLQVHRVGHLLPGRVVLLDEQLADLLPDLVVGIGVPRDELALDAAVVVARREQEQAEVVLDMADRLALHLAAAGELHRVRAASAVRQQVGVRIRERQRQRLQRRGQDQRLELVEAQRHGGARRGHLQVDDRVLRDEERQPHRRDLELGAGEDLARQGFGLLGRRRVAGEGRRRPLERLAARLLLERRGSSGARRRVGGRPLGLGHVPVQGGEHVGHRSILRRRKGAIPSTDALSGLPGDGRPERGRERGRIAGGIACRSAVCAVAVPTARRPSPHPGRKSRSAGTP
jgi:hypothetical protein